MRRKVSEGGHNVVTAVQGINRHRNNCTANRLCPTHLLAYGVIQPPRNSPANPLRHTAASVQTTVAPSILHPKDGGDPDDPSQTDKSPHLVRT